ncbi:MAG: NUDIX hydrolase [Flavobacteriales bacterium]|nr:NUDIX hydrolase [Flavobacteriales bacterium]MBK9597446.1 NUDIX hydrolase [Flavobacteriales bacterium]QQS72095.1 MAG: NUDIX hydrolase [Flavobacteriales bacterium]HQV40251.1 NUDIX hydrolase [Flavobacteriales bacterium]HQW33635.1 NUDIX hydrolase [Flavobacteriales bacterium]
MKKRGPWTTLSETPAYETPWISVAHHEVIDPGGKQGVYGVIHFKNLAVGVIPLDDEMNTWIVGQYRYPMEAYSWEMPEGGGDRNIPAVESAKRELREEVGLEAERFTEILQMDLSNSASDEQAIIFVAQGLTFHAPQPDHDEELKQRKLPFSELYEMVQRGEVRDSLTVAAVLKVQLMLLEGKLQK